MNIEKNDRSERAAKHAALGDPTRLEIVDLLTLGDLSPTELQQRLGISSNLLAHHLGLLEREGIVGRRRSDADRRRSYVRLVPHGLEGLAPTSAASPRRVVFVCTANSARSQLAEAIWMQSAWAQAPEAQKTGAQNTDAQKAGAQNTDAQKAGAQNAVRSFSIPAASAGIRPAEAIEPGAIETARRHGLVLPSRAPRHVEDVIEDEDCVITVCDTAHEELPTMGGGLHWSVPDPVPIGTEAAFDAAFEDIAQRIGELGRRLRIA